MKTNSHFKLSKATKRILARILDPHLYGQVKRGFIKAQAASEIKIKPNREDKKSQPAQE